MSILEAAATILRTTLPEPHRHTTPVFLSRMPDRPDQAICLYEYEGQAPVETLGPAPFALDQARLQAVCRGPMENYVAARDLALAVRRALAAVTDLTLADFRILRIAATGSVLPLGQDEHNRTRVSINFQTMTEP